MGELVELQAWVGETDAARSSQEAAMAADRFLIEEGLELLADYKSIDDAELRMQIKILTKMVAGLYKDLHAIK